MATSYLWKIYCETEAAWIQGEYPAASGTLTVCPNNAGHTVTDGSQAVVRSDYESDEDIGSDTEGQILVTTDEGTSIWTSQYNVIPPDDDLYVEVVRSGQLATEITGWRDSSKTFKIYKETITRTDGLVSQVVKELYDIDDGATLIATYTETYTRDNKIVTSETSIKT